MREAVQSVLAQTSTDFEIILIDDGSTEPIDLPANIKADQRIIYNRQPHRGASAARNHGISLAKGKYIAFLDSDDLFLPQKLERQLSYMEQHPYACFSHTSYMTMNSEGQYIQTIESGTFIGRVYPLVIIQCPIATPTVMIRKNILRDLKFDESIYPGEDNIFWIQIGKRYELFGINEPLTMVRLHGRNAAYDLHREVVGRIQIINYAVKRDPTMGFLFHRMSIVKVYWYAATSSLKRIKLTGGLADIIKVWPVALSDACLFTGKIIFHVIREEYALRVRDRFK